MEEEVAKEASLPGKPNCRFCGFGAFTEIRCPPRGSVTTEKVNSNLLIVSGAVTSDAGSQLPPFQCLMQSLFVELMNNLSSTSGDVWVEQALAAFRALQTTRWSIADTPWPNLPSLTTTLTDAMFVLTVRDSRDWAVHRTLDHGQDLLCRKEFTPADGNGAGDTLDFLSCARRCGQRRLRECFVNMRDVPIEDVMQAYEANIAHHVALLESRGRTVDVTIDLFASSEHLPDKRIQQAIREGMDRLGFGEA